MLLRNTKLLVLAALVATGTMAPLGASGGRTELPTLTSIASRFRTTVRQLMAWNKLRGTRLSAGNTLTIHQSPKF